MSYWYVTVYLLLYILTPFLSWIVKNSDKRFLSRLLIITTAIIPVYKILFSGAPVSQLGYGVYMWLVGAFIGKYGTGEQCNKAKKVFGCFTFVTICCFLSCYIVNRVANVEVVEVLSKMRGIISPFQAGVAIWLFLFFRDLKVPSQVWINKFSLTTLAVYIVHMNSYVREELFSTILKVSEVETKWYFILHLVISCMAIYVVISALDLIRRFFVRRLRLSEAYPNTIIVAIDKWMNVVTVTAREK
jgi:hypothetical protein